MPMTDREIFAGLSQNDKATTEYVYKTLAPPIFKYVLSNNGTRDEAKDLFQETYVKVLKKIRDEKYNHQEKFEAYFITIARNTWIDQLRTKKRRLAVGDEDALLQRADDSGEEALLQLVLHDKRLEALHGVWEAWEDTDCRRILQRFHYDNTRTKDIALSEGVSQNTLLQRLFKCRSKLFRLVSQRVEKQ
jgi:RNA polymerase sigma factor (sigma-70 family)